MWSKGIEYRKREKEKLSKISSKDLPFDVFVKNGELVSWRRSGSGIRELISFTKKIANEILEEIKILKLQLKGIITESAMSCSMLGFNKKFSDD
jgi:putative nmeDIP very short patch repair endonuclease